MAEAKDSPLNNVEDTDFETRLAAVEILLNYGAHVNAKTQAQETPLHFAVRNNCLKVAQLLVEYEANVYEVNQDRRTPLHVCAEFGHSKMAELLLKHCEQKANAVCKDYKIPAFEEINAIKMAKLLFNYCRYQADLHVSLDQVIKEFRSYPFRYRSRSYESYEDICYELNSNPRLKDCRQFWFWLPKALYKYYSVPCDFVTNGQHSAFENDDIEIHLLKRIQEMTVNKTFEDNATSLHRAVQSCRPSLFNDFQLQTADEKRLNNRVKNPNEQLEGEAVISSGEEIRLTELLNSWGKHPNQFDTRINARVFSHYATSKAMSYLYNDCYNGVNQSKNLRIKAYLKSHIMTKNDKTLVKNDKEEIVRSSVNKASGRDLFTFILYHADEYEVTSMRHLYVESFIEQDQAKTHSMTENVKCYVNMKDSEGYDVLLKAVECNRPDVLQLLMMNGAETCSITSQGYAALHIAVNSIHNASKTSNPIEMVKVLLTSGEFSVNALSFKAETPLHLATSNCGCGLSGQNLEELQRRRKIQDSVISLLLESKANVSQQDCEGLTPLMIASERGCYHIVKILIDWTSVKVDLDARDKYGETALIKAARMYHTKIVEELVNSGAQIDLQEYRGFTALHAALHDPNEFTSLFQLFENESQDIGLYDNEVNEKVYSRVEDAALISATSSLNGERNGENNLKNTLTKILSSNGIQFDTLDFANNTPFDFLMDSEIQSSRSRKEAQQRLDKIRNENSVFKETPCQLDSRWMLIKRRLDSPLFWVEAVCIKIAENKSIKLAEVQRIANIQDNKERTVLHYAAILSGFDRSSVFKDLLKSGCEIDARDIYKRTPLHYLDVSNGNLLLEVAQQIGMESTEEQQFIFRDILKMKDVDGKTVDDLRSLREGNAERERTRISDFHKALKAVDLGTIRYVNGTMKINKKGTHNFETDISWSIWTKDIADYAYRNTLTSCLTEEIHHFIGRLANAIERREPCFKCQPMLVGSAFEGTKIGSPDEFDFDFILTKFGNMVEVISSPVAPEGFVHLRRKPSVRLGETEKRWFDEEHLLKTNEINSRFQIILSKVFQDSSFWENEYLFESTDTEEVMKRFVRWYDRHKNGRDHNDLTDQRINPGICTTIRIKQTRSLEGQYLPNDISLDLVPCIHVDGWWPHKARSDISDKLKANGCNLVFDQPQRKYPWVPFGENYARISFAPAESQIIRDSSPTAKAAYMVCKHLIKDKPQMTYVLKTCLLYCIEARDSEEERSLDEESYYSSVTDEDLSSWVEKMMRCYLMFFLRDFCPCFLMPSFCLPIGDFFKSNHVLLNVTRENDYEFLKEENQSYRCSVREHYTTNFDLFRRVCTVNTDIPVPKPHTLCESFNHDEFISQIRACFFKYPI